MSITYASISSLLASPFQRLTSSMWNTASLLLIQLYETGGNAVTSILKNGNLTIPGTINADSGFFYDEIYIAGQPVLTELDPIYIAGFIATANEQINLILYSNEQLYYSIIKLPNQISNTLTQNFDNFYESFYQLVSSVSKKLGISLQSAIYFVANSIEYVLGYVYLATVGLANTINKLGLYLSPPTIQGLQLDVSTTPSPLYSGPSIETVRIILQNLSNYIVYIGNNLYNNFPILPNDSIEIHVNNPSNIYAWATGKCKVYALFEVIQ
ncbi:hypothetical protein CCL45_gp43 [Sulfolobus islandicus rod-shaped virus 5]|uniref:Uncharacterized protein n=2 Tax=Usarudivirus SIRV5 TaxID=2846591 RepID=A0A1X9SKK3_9VIRU|nr:hypothetical protein CCL45_gp43 [Sulfolobus islandicus rod-shaped virus 5]YP_009362904.1 hypothetical protein CCL44_gp42 [Sulfolobus islandicus rod-shaped phage 6]ARQ96665.1 hypothetical protein [Sulfolobus islandicus rod-shaped virus 5]ARQ96771.1 hypothetical protein [Sulfolobus islandicus rod-shaped phage 6]